MMRRRALLAGGVAAPLAGRAGAQSGRAAPQAWIDAAFAMKSRALGWGDQPYGAVLVLDGRIVGEGPSRVVADRDPDAHAERVALREAQRHLGRQRLEGSVLVSTSLPCAACQRAAAAAGVLRLHHGPDGRDAGPPRT